MTTDYRLELSLHKKKNKARKAKLGHKKSKRKMRYGIKRKPRVVRRQIASVSSRLWPEEEKALEDIHAGKTKMIDVSGEDFLQEIKSVINEHPSNTA